MAKYYVNNNQTTNPGLHHEVHREGCDNMPNDRTPLGDYSHCRPAVERAKQIYSDADGCYTCCNECHNG